MSRPRRMREDSDDEVDAHLAWQRYVDDNSRPRASKKKSGKKSAAPASARAVRGWMSWTVIGSLIPGVGLIKAGRRVAGWLMMLVVVLGLAAVVAYVVRDPATAAGQTIAPDRLRVITIGLIVVAALWAIVILISHRLLRPKNTRRGQRVVAGLVALLMIVVTAAPLLVGARMVNTTAQALGQIFQSEEDTDSQTRPTIDAKAADVWKDKPRVNIALLGGDWSDSDARRNEGTRTDTMMVASIDTQTGDTTIFQLPRNTSRMPFPEGSALAELYPYGFYDGYNADDPEFFANAIYNNVPAEHPELFTDTDYKGADAIKLALGAAFGLDVDYFVLLNIDGLVKLIDAMGGVRINVNERIPIAGSSNGSHPPIGYIEPGENKLLSGWHAMWYARSRSSSDDYSRMGRQTCVIQAVIDQANPQTMLTKYQEIAAATTGLVYTDIPSEMLPPLVELASRVQQRGNVVRHLFVPSNGFKPWDPDWEMVRAEVTEAIATTGGASPSQTPSSEAPSSETPSSEEPSTDLYPSETPSTTPKPGNEQISNVCAYNPVDTESPTPGAPTPTPTR